MSPDYPNELLWNGRQPDQTFDPEESLYFRVTRFDIHGKVNVDEIRCPDTSVNRGKFSEPKHVLYANFPKFTEHKVAQFQVREIPGQLETGDGRTISFEIQHDPEIQSALVDENYAHSEIRAFENRVRLKRVSEFVSKKYRMRLRQVMVPVDLGRV